MISLTEIIAKIRRKWTKLRLQPIRVFCFHHACEAFDASVMYQIDWLQTDVFKGEINRLRAAGYTFISLYEAYEHLQHDSFRRKKYAVLTADDGWASLKEILPWLNNQQIPVTLFLNPLYLDGIHYREKESEKYLVWDEVKSLAEIYPLVTIGSHGWEHIDVTTLTIEEFKQSITHSKAALAQLSNYMPFYAFPYGQYTREYVHLVKELGLVPLLVSGNQNVLYRGYIDRELLGLKT